MFAIKTENPENNIYGSCKILIQIQNKIDDTHIMRIICEIDKEEIKVITFYPAKRDRYEDQL